MPMEQTVLQAKRLGVFTCNQNQTLSEASKLMVDEDISALIVVDINGYLTGIITRIDLLRAYVENEDWVNQLVGDFMNREVVVVSPHTKLERVAEILVNKGIHRVVVVREEDGKRRPISVVSAADLVYHLVKSE